MYQAEIRITFDSGTEREREFREEFEHECSVPVGDWVQNKIGETVMVWGGSWKIVHGNIGHIEQSAYRTTGHNEDKNISFEIFFE